MNNLPTCRRGRRRPSSVLLLFFTALAGSRSASASLPKVDFDRMGKVGLAGSFAGLDLFDNSSSSLSFDPTTSTLLSRASDGSLTRLGSTNSGGRINAGCALGNSFYFAGDFSSINGTSATNVAAYSTDSDAFSPLGSNGPNGEVKSIFCDSTHNKVWVGGTFTSPGKAVAVWDTNANSWSAPPFGGLSGAAADVLSITTNSSASSLFFSGSFITSFGGNGSVINSTNNPNVPFSSGATPFSSSLVPIPLQNAQIDAGPATSDPNFSNINNILCPSGPDGPGQSWLAADGGKAVITVRTFTQLNANGIRLGNTFQADHGTTGFSVTSIPDNTVQTLMYVDPTSGQNLTCSDNCPLGTNPSVLYQDFLFSSDLSLTGFQLTLSQWTGDSPGLHIMQLLSSGAFASSAGNGNALSCFAPNPSNLTTNGDWNEQEVTTDIAGTVQDVLVAKVPVGTSPNDAPSITWMPYVSASGTYNVNMLVPGCTNFQDCDARTSVKVTIFPGGSLPPQTTTISQQNTDDAIQLIYSGPVFPSSPSFVATVTMTLADQPVGQGEDGQYELVADRIEFQLLSVTGNGTVNVTVGTNGTGASSQGFGFFEWPLSSTSNVDATNVLPSSSETSLDNVGVQLLNAIGTGAATSNDVVSAVAHHSSGAIFLGGNFSTSTGSNIVAFKKGGLVKLSGGGVNGPVTALAIEGDVLYVGGAFTDTQVPLTSGRAQGIVQYDVNEDVWVPMGSGVSGAVSDLNIANGQVEVTGTFTRVLDVNGGASAGGLAVWDISNGTWANPGGFLVGGMSLVANGTAPAKGHQQTQFLAGNIAASLKFGASGFVMLQNGQGDEPTVSTFNVQLEDPDLAQSPAVATKRRRSSVSNTWYQRVRLLFTRQQVTVPPLPPLPPTPAPAILTGVFWTNSSDSQDRVILGGNFSFTPNASVSESSGVAIYDLKTGGITALSGNPINGTVLSLFVIKDTLYVGGEFTVDGVSASGFAIYDLESQSLDMSSLQPLQASNGSPVVVRSISSSSAKPNSIIVAGSFASAGGVQCAGICALDVSSKQWSTLGSGINGEVASVAYGGSKQDVLFASGSIALLDGTSANVAAFSFDNSTWSAVGSSEQIPGPVTALTVDNGNSSSLFAAGRSTDGTSTFLQFWNGVTWSTLGSSLDGSSNISQLIFVPLQDTHSANGIIEQDRMLLVSGSIVSSTFGNVSSVLFDGQNFFPYFVSATSSGTPGMISSLFSSIPDFSFVQRHILAVGVVILISIAIAAGVVFLIVLLGILWTLFARRELSKFEYGAYEDDDTSTHQRPSSLLEHINAATAILSSGAGSVSPFDRKNNKEDGGKEEANRDPFVVHEHDGDHYVRAETPSEAMGMAVVGDEQGRTARARYSFDGLGEGELPLKEGMDIEVLDSRDNNWWYARDMNSGREGVVPAAYVT